MSDNMASTNGGDGSSSSNNNRSSRGNGRGRGGRRGRWAPLNLTEENFAPAPSSAPTRGRGHGLRRGGNNNFRPFENPHHQRNTDIVEVHSTAASSPIPRRHVVGMNSDPEAPSPAEASAAPSGKKNRRNRGRGKNEDAAALQVKKKTTFMDLPFELRERIMVLAHDWTMEELPACRPRVTNKPLSTEPEAIRARARPAALTRLRNVPAKVGTNNKARKAYLWRNPGQWGPVFQVMYANKQLHEEAKRIRYREIRVEASISKNDPVPNNDDILMNRLQFKAIQDHTKYAVVEILHHQETVTIQRLIDALKGLKELKHLCVVVRTCHDWAFDQWSNNPGPDEDLLMFFGLGVETLTMYWTWSNKDPFDLEPDQFWTDGGDEYTSTVAEIGIGKHQDDFIEKTYKPSIWYKDPTDTSEVPVGKIAKHLRGRTTHEDKFCFQSPSHMKETFCPIWNIAPKNPYNHPDQQPLKKHWIPREQEWVLFGAPPVAIVEGQKTT